MHFLLYVCLPTDEAATSLKARQRVCEYLNEERFVSDARFSGHCDYFLVGGRYSGMLNLLRLKHQNPEAFQRFLAESKKSLGREEMYKIFKRNFPQYDGMISVFPTDVPDLGFVHDAQIIDEPLFAELKDGFSEYVSNALAFDNPNVIFTDLVEEEWPVTAEEAVGRHWVVVIDYHD